MHEMLHTGGKWALKVLLVTLVMTPLRELSQSTVWLHLRRTLGLFAYWWVVKKSHSRAIDVCLHTRGTVGLSHLRALPSQIPRTRGRDSNESLNLDARAGQLSYPRALPGSRDGDGLPASCIVSGDKDSAPRDKDETIFRLLFTSTKISGVLKCFGDSPGLVV